MLFAVILAMQLPAPAGTFGVAAATQDGQICLAMPGPALTPAATITLVRVDGEPSALALTIVRAIPACERLERALVPGPYYLTQRPAPTKGDAARLWIAFRGRPGTRQARSCTSREGLHLTVWSGAPLTSQRLWHQYFYLGYDVEPSCDERDIPK